MPKTPAWLMRASFAVLVLTLGFMMMLVLLATLGKEVPTGSRYLVVIVLAIGAAFSIGGLGGEAAVRGKIPVPGAQEHPLAVSATGGAAVLLIVLLLGDRIVPGDRRPPDLTLQSLKGVSTSGDPPRVMLTARFQGFSVSGGEHAALELCKDPRCADVVQTARIDNPMLGDMVVFIQGTPESVTAGRLYLENPTTGETLRGRPARASW